MTPEFGSSLELLKSGSTGDPDADRTLTCSEQLELSIWMCAFELELWRLTSVLGDESQLPGTSHTSSYRGEGPRDEHHTNNPRQCEEFLTDLHQPQRVGDLILDVLRVLMFRPTALMLFESRSLGHAAVLSSW